jgi:hypothetical protein
MDGLTAKVFRTYNASFTLEEELAKMPDDAQDWTVDEKMLFYNRANREVAILCNHQRTVSKNFGSQIGKIDEKVILLFFLLTGTRSKNLRIKKKTWKTTLKYLREVLQARRRERNQNLRMKRKKVAKKRRKNRFQTMLINARSKFKRLMNGLPNGKLKKLKRLENTFNINLIQG